MNKTIVGVIIAAVVIVGGGLLIMHMSGGSDMSMSGTSTSTPSNGTMMALLARGSSQCQVNDPKSGTSGTVYIGSGEMRGDFSAQQDGKTVTSHMISDGKTVYVWSSAMAEGMKMAVTASSSAPASSGQSAQANIYNASVDYTCTPWSSDSSEFTLPAGVTFEDMNAMMQGAVKTNAGASGSVNACGACDQAPNAAAKAQCRAALHC